MPNYFSENDLHIFVCDSDEAEYHTHPFLELVYVLHGSAVHVLDGQESIIRKGDFFFLNYGSYHSYRRVGAERFSIVNCLFLPGFIDKSLVSCRDFNDLLNHYLIRLQYETLKDNPSQCVFRDEDGAVLHYMNHMLDEYQRKECGYPELIRCCLIELIIHAMRKIRRNTPEVGNVSLIIRDKINQRYMEHITLTQIARELSFSLPYLSKVFKQNTNLSFSEYLQKVRIEQSCRLLANTDKKIIEVAALAGYSDVNFYGKVFRKNLHMSPSRFRQLSR